MLKANLKKKAEIMYTERRQELYEPTRLLLRKMLGELLQKNLDSNVLLRSIVEEGHVKPFDSLWKKADSSPHRSKIRKPDDIFRYVGDIVRTRITCNVLSDVMRVCEVIRAVGKRPSGTHPHRPSLCISRTFPEQDYISKPWSNGYRAIHLYVEIESSFKNQQVPVVCEVQVRTLLQDAWGKLTHKDFYKSEDPRPPLLSSLGKNLAEVLNALDAIAQDIRTDIDRISRPLKLHRRSSVSKKRQAKRPDAPVSTEATVTESKTGPKSGGVYSAGDSVTAEVVSAGEQYALFKLPDGRIGILHWSQVRTGSSDYVDVRDCVSVGQTRQVRIFRIDPDQNRIELTLEPA